MIGRSSLGVVVDNIKLIDLFSALYVPLESGRQVKNEEKLVIRTATRLIWSDITSLNIDRVWYLDTSTYSDVKK